MAEPQSFTAFAGARRIAAGDLATVAAAVHGLGEAIEPVLIIEDATGRPVDLDLRGDADAVRARYTPEPAAKPGRGRPRLGVAAREVTLLPSQWEWLAQQPGGASATLRRLVDQARRSGAEQRRQAQDAAHRVTTLLAGDLPQYEDALRAFYAGDFDQLGALVRAWPTDIADYVLARMDAVRSPEA